ncbi:hypothetical protein EIN_135490 [Entamoeba invadens IP1]|uniref:Uncharacterized protein n=1 Tax=Entamoeba invadens IP1 TaxID=370355 RepID=A0A0A1TXA4_ENTIV|nr:hypothetical protein EIN_135490 [Entamoeba invadens IP1]ELP85945.1 hypothetical protein EIN_135490 [Entamoeba invadens IP1]|eukprot:XP_004185291.1 hypothetical protein EIN_135490 [Entamoeba invadens IP1]
MHAIFHHRGSKSDKKGPKKEIKTQFSTIDTPDITTKGGLISRNLGEYTLARTNSRNGALWMDLKEDDFFLSATICASVITNGGFAIVIQSEGRDALGTDGKGKGAAGIKNAIAVSFRFQLSLPSIFSYPSYCVYVSDGSKGVLDVRPTNGTNIAKLPVLLLYKVKVKVEDRRLTCIVDGEELINCVIKKDSWGALGAHKYIGVTFGTDNHAPMFSVRDLQLLYCDCPEMKSIRRLAQFIKPRTSLVGNCKECAEGLSLIEKASDTSAVWFSILPKKGVMFKFTICQEAVVYEGFSVVLQNSGEEALGKSYDGLGYEGIKNGTAVEFSFKSSPTKDDPSFGHIGVMLTEGQKGISSNHKDGCGITENIPKELVKGERCDISVFFGTDCVVCWVNKEVILRTKNVRNIFGKKMWVGLTASTSVNVRCVVSNIMIWDID